MYRAFFAMISRPLTTSSGENTSAPYGIPRFLLRLVSDYEPDYLGVVFDAGDSQRGEIFPDYKATREKMPDELRASLVRCREIFEAFRVPVLEAQGWEADDVIGTLAKQAAAQGLRTVIVSGDKDFHQLVDEHTLLLNPGRGGPAGVEQLWVTPENAEERMGVPPARVTDFLALLGDTSDNVPGVPGIGKKTAPDLIREFGDLETLLERAEEVTAKRARNALIEHADSARLSKQLVTIRTDAPATLSLEDLTAEEIDRDRALAVFRELEFHNLVRDLEAAGGPTEKFEPECSLVTDTDALAAALADIGATSRLGLWLAGSNDDPLGADLVGLAISDRPDRAIYLSFGHRPPEIARDADGNPTLMFEVVEAPNLPPLTECEELVALLEGTTPKIGHDLKFVSQVLLRHGVTLGAVTFDTELASYCLDPAARDRALDVLAPDKLGAELPSRATVTGTGRGAIALGEADAVLAMSWAAPHSAVTLPLADAQDEELERVGMRTLCRDVELPLIPVLASMERAGVAIDMEFFAELGARFEREIRLVREEIQNAGAPDHQEDEDRAVDRRKRPRGAGRAGSRDPAAHSRASRAGQTGRHLRPKASAARRRRLESAHPVQSDRGRDREAVLVGPQPPEHPDPCRPRSRDPEGVRPRPRTRVHRRRLLPGRVACHGASLRRQGVRRGVPGRP
jgi:DNA polymerase-1